MKRLSPIPFSWLFPLLSGTAGNPIPGTVSVSRLRIVSHGTTGPDADPEDPVLYYPRSAHNG